MVPEGLADKVRPQENVPNACAETLLTVQVGNGWGGGGGGGGGGQLMFSNSVAEVLSMLFV